MNKKLSKAFKIILQVLLAIIIVFLLLHSVGRFINKITPRGGINKSMYVEVNGTRQWINIYGKNIKNPVLLYLHGGPGSSTSAIDYAFTRKWADVYTVVTWDQRNCGKSYSKKNKGKKLTCEQFLKDGKEMTEFIQKFMKKDKITILGHSWGSIYGASLVLAYPEYYECFIGTGQVIDMYENEVALKEAASEWASGDETYMAYVDQLTPGDMTMTHINARNELMEKYGYGIMRDGTDYNIFTTILFNPNYSVIDWIEYFRTDFSDYLTFIGSEEFGKISIQGKYEYKVPYYNINGDQDYQTNYILAGEYFEKVNAPYKQLFIMKNTTHGLLESKSEWFSEYVHRIAKQQRRVSN